MKYRPVKMPAGTVVFRSAKWQDTPQKALDYNKSKDPRFYGEVPVASAYLNSSRNPYADLYAVWFKDLRLVDIRTFPSIVDNSFNDLIQSKIDTIYENDAIMDFSNRMLVNPLQFLRVKKGDYSIRTKTCNIDVPGQYLLDSYLDVEFLIKYLAFKICYGTTPASSIEDYLNAYNELVREYYKENPFIALKYKEIDIGWITGFLQLEVAGFRNRGFGGCGNLLSYIPVKYRNSISELDDIAVQFMKELCKHSGIDGYYSPIMKTPWGLNRVHGRNVSRTFHAEICVFDPEGKIEGIQQMFGGLDLNTYNNHFNAKYSIKIEEFLSNYELYQNLKISHPEMFIRLSALQDSQRTPKLMLINDNTQFGGIYNFDNFNQLASHLSFKKKRGNNNHILNFIQSLY